MDGAREHVIQFLILKRDFVRKIQYFVEYDQPNIFEKYLLDRVQQKKTTSKNVSYFPRLSANHMVKMPKF